MTAVEERLIIKHGEDIINKRAGVYGGDEWSEVCRLLCEPARRNASIQPRAESVSTPEI